MTVRHAARFTGKVMTQEATNLSHDDALALPDVGRLRLLVGLAQGLVLYGLYRAANDYAWPAALPPLFVAMVLSAVLAPVLLVSSLGHLPRRALAGWVLAAAVLAAALGAYDGWRALLDPATAHIHDRLFPSAPLCLATLAGFFIAHALVLTGYAERRRIASYEGYFETAWKLGVQLGFSALFVGAAWLVLWLGAQLFMLVKLTLFKEVIGNSWFVIPVTVFAFSAAMHITDVRPGIVRGIRGLMLTLLGWILPVATLIIAGFLVSLPFTGVAPLWATRSASALMLTGAAMLVVLINAAWQNGAALAGAAAPIRASSRLACVLLLPLALLATYALYLRVAEHGWTHDRIVAAACLVVAFSYAFGYLRAATGASLERIAPVNIATAFVVIGVLLALFSPVANPQRVSVASQLARLDSGKISAEKFDYRYLRFEGGRYGRDALAALNARTGKDAAAIRQGASRALAMTNQWETQARFAMPDVATAANIHVWPAGEKLPPTFTGDHISKPAASGHLSSCLTEMRTPCDAFLLDLVGDERREVVLVGQLDAEGPYVMGQDAEGKWINVGRLPYGVANCASIRAAILAGQVRTVATVGKDVEIGGKRLHVDYDADNGVRACAPPAPK
jgi:hypothetical protein